MPYYKRGQNLRFLDARSEIDFEDHIETISDVVRESTNEINNITESIETVAHHVDSVAEGEYDYDERIAYQCAMELEEIWETVKVLRAQLEVVDEAAKAASKLIVGR